MAEKPSSVRCKIMHRARFPQSAAIAASFPALMGILMRQSAYSYTSNDVCCIATIRLDARRQQRVIRTRLSQSGEGVMSSDKSRFDFFNTVRGANCLSGAAALSATAMMPPSALAQQFPTATVNTTGLAVTDTEVTVGILHSVTGTMAISETGSVQAEKLAIEQINAAGGVLGPQDQVHPGRRRQRLADLRREGEEAPGERQGRLGHGLLDVGVAQGGAAGVRAIQRHALLPDLLRRPRSSRRTSSTPARRRRSRSSPASTGCRRRRAPRPSICSAPTTSGRARRTRSRASTSRTSSSSRSSARNTSRSATRSSTRRSTRSSSPSRT